EKLAGPVVQTDELATDDEGLVALALEREPAAVRLDARCDLRCTGRELVVQLSLHRAAEYQHQRETNGAERDREREDIPGGEAQPDAHRRTLPVAQPVAHSADCLDRASLTAGQVAETRDVDVDDVRDALIVAAPAVLLDLAAPHDIALSSQEVLEDGELARGELDRFSGVCRGVARRVEADLARAEDRRPLGHLAAHERANARGELRERERLHAVIVRTEVEPLDA